MCNQSVLTPHSPFGKARRWFMLLALLLVPLVLFSPVYAHMLLTWLTSSSISAATGACPVFPRVVSKHPFIALQFALDTPPWYNPSVAHKAAVAIADKIDASVVPDTGGMAVFVSYISGHSFQNEVFSFSVPAVDAFPPSPPPPSYGNDPYKNSILKTTYQHAINCWKQTVATMQRSLSKLQASVKRDMNKLRSLTYPYNNQGSDIFGAYAEASRNLQEVHSDAVKKVFVLASDLVSTTTEQDTGAFSLSGVSVVVIYHTCLENNAATCIRNDASWKQVSLQAGATNFVTYTVPQSETLPLSLW